MSILADIAGKKVCGGSNEINTGKLGCLVELSSPEHFIAVRKGFRIPGNVDFNIDYITEQTQRGIFIPVLGASNFEDLSAEDGYNTNSSGVKRLNLKGLPEFNFMYEEGHEFYRQIAKLQSFKSYDFILGDDEGNWSMVKTASGDYKGYSMGHVTPGITKRKVKGGDNEMKPVLFQFLDRMEYDINYEIFTAAELGFYPSDIKTVNGVVGKFNTIPSNSDTSLDLKLVLASDKNTPLEGALVSNFRVLVNGVSATVSAATEPTPGDYALTVPAVSTGDDIGIGFWDSTLNTNIVLIGDNLYRMETLEAETIL